MYLKKTTNTFNTFKYKMQRKPVFCQLSNTQPNTCICSIHVFVSPYAPTSSPLPVHPFGARRRSRRASLNTIQILLQYTPNAHRIHALNTRSWRCCSDSHSDTLNTQIRVTNTRQIRVNYASQIRVKYALHSLALGGGPATLG